VEYRFQVNLSGIIDLLSNHLYSGPQVFLRELLQNSTDAIAARRQIDTSFRGGHIRIEVVSEPGSPATLLVEDDGIGLDEADVHRFLATIGASSKRDALGAARADFIGQFGIGLLSCFMVADEIVMITRPATGHDDGHCATEWRGRPDGTYAVRRLDKPLSPGTRVYLRCKPGAESFFDPRRVRELAAHFGGMLACPVQVTAGRQTWTVNAPAPWEQEYDSAGERRDALLAYGKEVFETDFFDCVELKTSAGDVSGVAFVLPYSPSAAAKGRHRIYLKRMLLSEAGDGILPEWAFFVRCVVNANGLRPTASRESFYEDAELAAAREALGRALRDYLVRLAREEPRRLEKLIALHLLSIQALAVHDETFYRVFVDWLPFETSAGVMQVRQLRRSHKAVRYVRTADEFRQVARVAASQDMLVVNAGYTYAEELLLRLPDAFQGMTVEAVTASSLSQSFAELSLDEREQCFGLLRTADAVLRPFRCAADVRRFEPAELATLYSTDPDAALYRAADQNRELDQTALTGAADSLLGTNAGDAASAVGKRPYAQLVFNFNNPLVRKLARVRDRAALTQCLQMLYVQSLLLGHHPLSAKEMALLNGGLTSLIEAAAATGGLSGSGGLKGAA